MATDHDDDKIRVRAYELWEAAGRPDGDHEGHWHQARAELDGPYRAVPADSQAATNPLSHGKSRAKRQPA